VRRPSFEERERGIEMPTQLGRQEVSQELRAVLWHEISTAMFSRDQYGNRIFRTPWKSILRDKHTFRDHQLKRFPDSASTVEDLLRVELAQATYDRLYGLLEYLLRHEATPPELGAAIEGALVAARAPYRILDRDTVVPITTEELGSAVRGAVDDAAATGMAGARQHLKSAASMLGSGRWADSVRESIHAVESVALVLSPGTETLGPALKAIGGQIQLHEALKKGFLSIYGFTSDESGIRHALLEKGDADVDETDALFMLGACASFVSYLIGKGKSAGLV
jgi:hypothetical protein